jgi:hypothetical protein
VREADNVPPYSADVKKSRSLNSPRPLWACMACNECALPYYKMLGPTIKRKLVSWPRGVEFCQLEDVTPTVFMFYFFINASQ